jgi:hypothetical protein
VKCNEVKIGPSEFTVFITGMWVVFDFRFGKQPADFGWYSRDATSVGFLLCVQGLFLVCERLLWKSGAVVMNVHAVACNFLPHTTLQLVSDPESSQCNKALWPGQSVERIPLGARLSVPLQTGPEAHPVPCTVGTGTFLGEKQGGHGADHSPLSSAKIMNGLELQLHLISVSAQACHGVTFTFHVQHYVPALPFRHLL